MPRDVPATEFSRNFARYREEAIAEKVISVTSHGRSASSSWVAIASRWCAMSTCRRSRAECWPACVGEFVAATHGLGYLLSFAQSTYNAARMFALILLIIVVVMLILAIAGRLERHLLRWN
jgi:ABC-type phosphate/phosphonate transport system permease subunit